MGKTPLTTLKIKANVSKNEGKILIRKAYMLQLSYEITKFYEHLKVDSYGNFYKHEIIFTDTSKPY